MTRFRNVFEGVRVKFVSVQSHHQEGGDPMNTTNRFLVVLLAFLLLTASGLVAQEKTANMKMGEMKGVQGSFLKQSKAIEQQFVSLAQAVPQEKYNWRPEEGVRSVAESFLHVAAGNYITLMTMGGKVPEGVDARAIEKSTTDKAKIVEEIKKSFKAVNDYVASVPDKDFERHVNFFGNDMTVLDMIMLAATHQHETLGQTITYARMNHVVPPWTEERQTRMRQQQNKD